MLSEFLCDDAVEFLGNDAAVEGFDLKVEIVRCDGQVDRLREGVEQRQFLAALKMDAGDGESSLNPNWWLLVDEEAVNDGFAQAVGEDWAAEDLCGVQRRRGGKADLHRVEVVQNAAILRDVVGFAAEA